jgi:hypothetical protein
MGRKRDAIVSRLLWMLLRGALKPGSGGNMLHGIC